MEETRIVEADAAGLASLAILEQLFWVLASSGTLPKRDMMAALERAQHRVEQLPLVRRETLESACWLIKHLHASTAKKPSTH